MAVRLPGDDLALGIIAIRGGAEEEDGLVGLGTFEELIEAFRPRADA